MGDGPIELVIQPVTIDTMPNSNGLFIGGGLNFVTCERSFIDIVGHVLKSRSGYGYLSKNGYKFEIRIRVGTRECFVNTYCQCHRFSNHLKMGSM